MSGTTKERLAELETKLRKAEEEGERDRTELAAYHQSLRSLNGENQGLRDTIGVLEERVKKLERRPGCLCRGPA